MSPGRSAARARLPLPDHLQEQRERLVSGIDPEDRERPAQRRLGRGPGLDHHELPGPSLLRDLGMAERQQQRRSPRAARGARGGRRGSTGIARSDADHNPKGAATTIIAAPHGSRGPSRSAAARLVAARGGPRPPRALPEPRGAPAPRRRSPLLVVAVRCPTRSRDARPSPRSASSRLGRGAGRASRARPCRGCPWFTSLACSPWLPSAAACSG